MLGTRGQLVVHPTTPKGTGWKYPQIWSHSISVVSNTRYQSDPQDKYHAWGNYEKNG